MYFSDDMDEKCGTIIPKAFAELLAAALKSYFLLKCLLLFHLIKCFRTDITPQKFSVIEICFLCS